MTADVTVEDYFRIREFITYENQVYSQIIALISDPQKIEVCRELGRRFGLIGILGNDFMAFIPDEIKHSKQQAGKSYEDIRKGILTYPFIHYFSSNKDEREFICSVLGSREASQEDMRGVIAILLGSGSLKAHLSLIEEMRREAIQYVYDNFQSAQDNLAALFRYWMDLGLRYRGLKGLME
jgi:geranylgeranyl pyrophosphate synthase